MEMIHIQLLIGQHFLVLDIIQELKNVMSRNPQPPSPPKVKMTFKGTKLIYGSSPSPNQHIVRDYVYNVSMGE